MKTMKLALLGGAALAVSAIGAQADDLTALKAEIEALNARVQQLEAAPAAPSGYSLLTSSVQQRTVVPGNEDGEVRGISDTAHVIGVLPTADAAPSTTIEWSGYVYALVAATDYGYYGGNTDVNVIGRGHLRVVGKTDTAVGEVGVRVQLRSQWAGVDGDNGFFGHEYWGWWAMTPELTLGGGYSGSLGNIGYGLDGACNCWWTDWFSSEIRGNQSGDSALNALNPGDTTQVRLSYGSGPLSFAIALEEGDIGSAFGAGDLAVAGEIKYSGDSFSGEISAIAYNSDDQSNGGHFSDNGWQIGAGVGFGLGDMANISLAAGFGDNTWTDYWSVSGLINFNLSDAVHAEVGAAFGREEFFDHEMLTVLAGIYYAPVSQLTIGLEGQWTDADVFAQDFTTFDVVTIYSF